MRNETTLFMPHDHPAFAGHFAGHPIVPGVVLLDAVVHAVQQGGARANVEGAPTGPSVCQISSAKFLRTVGPGETLTIAWDTAASGSIQFDIAGGNGKVATGTLVWPQP